MRPFPFVSMMTSAKDPLPGGGCVGPNQTRTGVEFDRAVPVWSFTRVLYQRYSAMPEGSAARRGTSTMQ